MTDYGTVIAMTYERCADRVLDSGVRDPTLTDSELAHNLYFDLEATQVNLRLRDRSCESGPWEPLQFSPESTVRRAHVVCVLLSASGRYYQ